MFSLLIVQVITERLGLRASESVVSSLDALEISRTLAPSVDQSKLATSSTLRKGSPLRQPPIAAGQ